MLFGPKKKIRATTSENVFKEYLDVLSFYFNVQKNLDTNLSFTKFIFDKANLTDKNSVVYQTTSDFISMILSQQNNISYTSSSYSPNLKSVGVDEIFNAFVVVDLEKKEEPTETDKNNDLQDLVNNIIRKTKLDILYTNSIGKIEITAPQPIINDDEKKTRLTQICAKMMCLVKGSTICKYPISIDLKNKILSYKTSTTVKESKTHPKVKENVNDQTLTELTKIFFLVVEFLIRKDYGKNILHKNILEQNAFSQFYIDDFENGVFLDRKVNYRRNIEIIDSNTVKISQETFQTKFSTNTEYRDLVRREHTLLPLGLFTRIQKLSDFDKKQIFLDYCQQIYYITDDLNTISPSQNIFNELPQNFFQSICEIIDNLDSEFLKNLCRYIVLIRKPISGNIFSIKQVTPQDDHILSCLLNSFDEKGGKIYSEKDLKFLSYIFNLDIPDTINIKKSLNIEEKTYKSNLNELNVAVSLLKTCSENPIGMTMIGKLKDYKYIDNSERKLLSIHLRTDRMIRTNLKKYFNTYFLPENNFQGNFTKKQKIYFSFDCKEQDEEIVLTLMKTEIVKTTTYTYSVDKTNINKIYQLEGKATSVNCKLYDYLFKDPNGVRLLYNSYDGISQRTFSNIISNIDYKNFDGKEMLIPDSTNLYLIICDSSNDFSLTDTKTGNIYSPIMKIYSKVFGEAYNQKFGGNDYFYTKNNNSSLGSSLSLQTHLDNFECKNFASHSEYYNVFSFYDFVNENDDKIQLNSYFYNDEKNPGECIIAYNNIKELTYVLPCHVEKQKKRKRINFFSFKKTKNEIRNVNEEIRKYILNELPELKTQPTKKNKNTSLVVDYKTSNDILNSLQRIINKVRIGQTKFKLDDANLTFVEKNEKIRPTVNIEVSLEITPFIPGNIDFIMVQLGETKSKIHVSDKTINFSLENIQLKTDMRMKIDFLKKRIETNRDVNYTVGSCVLYQNQWNDNNIEISDSVRINVRTIINYSDHLDDFVSEYFKMYNDTETAAEQLYIYLLYTEYMKNRKDMKNSIFVEKYPQRKGLANKMSKEDNKMS